MAMPPCLERSGLGVSILLVLGAALVSVGCAPAPPSTTAPAGHQTLVLPRVVASSAHLQKPPAGASGIPKVVITLVDPHLYNPQERLARGVFVVSSWDSNFADCYALAQSRDRLLPGVPYSFLPIRTDIEIYVIGDEGQAKHIDSGAVTDIVILRSHQPAGPAATQSVESR